jgi:hypothetical protein
LTIIEVHWSSALLRHYHYSGAPYWQMPAIFDFYA